MRFTIMTVGGRVAAEGAAILEAAGAKLVETDVYPEKTGLIESIRTQQPDALIVRLIDRIDGDMMRASRKLRLIAKHGAGANDIDTAAAAELGIPVITAVGANAHSVAEHALGLMLALSKDILRQDARIRAGEWDKKSYAGRELRGQKLGLVGLGLIGQALTGMARALGMTVTAFDPYAPDNLFGSTISRTASLDELLATSDIVSLHCPLTETTRNLMDAGTLGLMKPTALLINTARGEVVDEAALVEALAAGRIAGAGLDSFAPEPPVESALWKLPNVILTPHVAGVTEEARRAVSTMTAENVIAHLRGETLDRRFFARG